MMNYKAEDEENNQIIVYDEDDRIEDLIYEPTSIKNEVAKSFVNPTTKNNETQENLNWSLPWECEQDSLPLSSSFKIDGDLASFAHYVAVELQTVKNPYARNLAKRKINSILYEACTGQYDNFGKTVTHNKKN